MNELLASSGVSSPDGCLHLVMRAQPALLENCLVSCAPGDTIVLLDAAVVLCAGVCPKPEIPVHLCCLEADVRARGIERLIPPDSWTMISDQDLVDKVTGHRHCLSWK